MISLDQYVDTRAKRKSLFHIGYLLITIFVIYTYLKTAIILLSIQNYDALFSVMSSASLNQSFLARVVLSCMSMSKFDIVRLCVHLLSACRWLDSIWLISTMLVFASDVYRDVRKQYLIPFLIYFLLFVVIGVIGVIATQATSLMNVVQYIHIIAWILGVSQIVLTVLCTSWMLKEIKAYRYALAYKAMEVIE